MELCCSWMDITKFMWPKWHKGVIVAYQIQRPRVKLVVHIHECMTKQEPTSHHLTSESMSVQASKKLPLSMSSAILPQYYYTELYVSTRFNYLPQQKCITTLMKWVNWDLLQQISVYKFCEAYKLCLCNKSHLCHSFLESINWSWIQVSPSEDISKSCSYMVGLS
jgi:hypothetical protein